ncbi:hypothetical protein PGT21_023243 [Puccinia graminis f. sp. tritici]|uniref:Uncharacterized protein n=1 Tax=Puccinia graminis f. sp. tritici TaxID=56615 RepID=A0A5B0P8J6_PUCGR|nr:hypothetical protein PGT21_023243 [Puccinia graminis f. sp. tritici]
MPIATRACVRFWHKSLLRTSFGGSLREWRQPAQVTRPAEAWDLPQVRQLTSFGSGLTLEKVTSKLRPETHKLFAEKRCRRQEGKYHHRSSSDQARAARPNSYIFQNHVHLETRKTKLIADKRCRQAEDIWRPEMLYHMNSDRYAFKGKLNRLHERPTRGDFDYKMPLAQRVSLLQPSTAPAQIFPVYQLTRLKASTKNIPTDN